MSDDIVQRLRDACPATQDFTHTTQGALMDEAADHIEQLTAERDSYRKALEDIIKDYEPGYPLSHDVIKYVARAALKGESHEG